MKRARQLFAIVLLLISLFSIPELGLLHHIINFCGGPPETEQSQMEDEFNENDPLMIKAIEEVNKMMESTAYKIWSYSITLAMLLIVVGGFYAVFQILRNHRTPYIVLILVSCLFFYTGGAPWELNVFFKGVDSLESIVRRVDILWKHDALKNSIITNGAFGTFYLATGIICAVLAIKQRVEKF